MNENNTNNEDERILTDEQRFIGVERELVLTRTNAKGEKEELRLKAHAFSDKEINELDEWVRTQYIETSKKYLPDSSMPEVIKEAMTLTWIGGQGAKILSTPDGMAKLVQQMTRYPDGRKPEYATLKSFMFSAENIRATNSIFKDLNIDDKSLSTKNKTSKKRAKKANLK